MPLDLAYFYGGEAEQYSFYRIPKTLFTDCRYEGVSKEAKLLYGLMLDRMGLSVRNGWMDEQQRGYIYFTLEDSMAMMGCGHNKAIKLFAALEQIGLIERKKQGQGRPARIYVKNFTPAPASEQADNPEPSQPAEDGQTSPKGTLIRLIGIRLNGTILSPPPPPVSPRRRSGGLRWTGKASWGLTERSSGRTSAMTSCSGTMAVTLN